MDCEFRKVRAFRRAGHPRQVWIILTPIKFLKKAQIWWVKMIFCVGAFSFASFSLGKQRKWRVSGLCGGFSANVHRVDSQVLNMFTEY